MLILSRRVGESFRIGDDIEVMVTRIGKDQVKVGITAPRGMRIVREELIEKGETNGSND